MAYTKFGELVRIIRIRHHEVMGDMAKKLGLKLPFFSAIESGKKNVPAELITKIVECYHLSTEEEQELIEAAEESRTQYKISTIVAGIDPLFFNSQRKKLTRQGVSYLLPEEGSDDMKVYIWVPLKQT